jgi:chromosome segregation ATPase
MLVEYCFEEYKRHGINHTFKLPINIDMLLEDPQGKCLEEEIAKVGDDLKKNIEVIKELQKKINEKGTKINVFTRNIASLNSVSERRKSTLAVLQNQLSELEKKLVELQHENDT